MRTFTRSTKRIRFYLNGKLLDVYDAPSIPLAVRACHAWMRNGTLPAA